MNTKLMELYLEGISKGYIKHSQFTMWLTKETPSEWSVRLLDDEHIVYPQYIVLQADKTRRTAEFKKAVEIAESPLGEALK
jgi:hypothetical protein